MGRQSKIERLRGHWAERLVGPATTREERRAYWLALLRLGVNPAEINRWDAEEQRQRWSRKTEEMFVETGM